MGEWVCGGTTGGMRVRNIVCVSVSFIYVSKILGSSY
jgi:hypothetical protein